VKNVFRETFGLFSENEEASRIKLCTAVCFRDLGGKEKKLKFILGL
jgi:hypothetical protein